MKPPVKRFCPKCQKVLYNRRLEKCGHCAAPIPEDLRFSAEESAEVASRAAEVELSHKIRDAVQFAKGFDSPTCVPPAIIPPG